MTPTVPYAPLERLLRARYDSADFVPGLNPRGEHGLWCDDAAAVMLDTHRRRIQQWKTQGLPARTADNMAARAGLHPLEVWGQAWTCAEIATDIKRWHARRANAAAAREVAA